MAGNLEYSTEQKEQFDSLTVLLTCKNIVTLWSNRMCPYLNVIKYALMTFINLFIMYTASRYFLHYYCKLFFFIMWDKYVSLILILLYTVIFETYPWKRKRVTCLRQLLFSFLMAHFLLLMELCILVVIDQFFLLLPASKSHEELKYILTRILSYLQAEIWGLTYQTRAQYYLCDFYFWGFTTDMLSFWWSCGRS